MGKSIASRPMHPGWLRCSSATYWFAKKKRTIKEDVPLDELDAKDRELRPR